MFKEKLIKLRKENNYTQEELAKKLSISRQSISKWETGVSYPTKSMLEKLAAELNLNIHDLLNNEELTYISIDNLNSIKQVKTRTYLIMGFITSIAILIITLGIIVSNDIKKINKKPETIISNEIVVGVIILDEIGSNNLGINNSLNKLIEEGNYPYYYFNVEDNIWKKHNSLALFTLTTMDSIDIIGDVYVKTNSEISVVKIIYNTKNNSYDLIFNSIINFSTDAGNNINILINEEKNKLFNQELLINLNIISIDNLKDTEIIEYDYKNEILATTVINSNDSISLNKDTMHFVIKEIFETKSSNKYIVKTLVHHNDFKYIYYHNTIITNNTNIYAINLIQINTNIK